MRTRRAPPPGVDGRQPGDDAAPARPRKHEARPLLEPAARLWGAGTAVKDRGTTADDELLRGLFVAEAREALGVAVFDAVIEEGRSLGFEGAVALSRPGGAPATVR